MNEAIDWLSREWQAMAAGAGIYGAVREVIGMVIRLKAAQMRGNADPSDDAMAAVLEDAAKRIESKAK